MANIFLAWQNRADEGTLAGGSWTASLPLTNLQNRTVQKVARSTNVNASSTQFTLDLQQSRVISALALVGHNISVLGKVRVNGSDSAAAWTNLLTNESDFTNAAWTKATVTVTGNNTIAPDGTTTADRLAATAANSSVSQTVTIGAAQAYTGSVWLRADAPTTISIVTIQTPSNTVAEVVCNVTTVWQKFTIQGTTVAGTTSMGFYVGGNNSFSTGETVYAWDAEVVLGTGAVYESGWNEVWPAGIIPTELLEWEDDNFWLGTLTQEQRAGFQSPYILRINTLSSLRYWRVEISDTTNPAGWIQIGRLFMARGWTPSVNYVYGAGLGYQDPTPVDTSFSGAEFFDIRQKFRVMQFRLDYISDSEAYSYALELQRLAGISGEVLVQPDGGENPGQQPLRSFVGRLRQMSQVTQPQPSTFSVDFEVKELL